MKTADLLEFYNELIIKQDYFECHEIMEEAWKSKAERTKEDPEVFLILMAVGEYHYRRGNIAGAVKSYQKALTIFDRRPFVLEKGGLEPSIISIMEGRLSDMHDVPFSPLEFPLTQTILIELNSTYMPAMPYESFLKWRKKRHVTDEFTVNKHLMRDRRQVEADRKAALKKRKHQD
ncbi:DUF309 domain-containing protein [Salinicoccus carnicancri]|uniref:DUF309 domain-containing protein n=1 Tax=Salinicoccus carnicancri TaxID=558170 RepID=UPI000367A101|nr:DUF309 domain-containing protein [Salinicoccus carnicancri]